MRRILPLAVALVLLLPAAIQARMLVVTSGPTVVHVGDPGPVTVSFEESLPPSVSVGYRYDSFSLFWVDFWTWDGGYCLYGGRMQPRAISGEHAAHLLGKVDRSLTAPFAYRYPPGLFVLAPVLLFGILLIARRRRSRSLARLKERTDP